MGAIDLASLIVKFVDEIYEKVKRGKKIDDKDHTTRSIRDKYSIRPC